MRLKKTTRMPHSSLRSRAGVALLTVILVASGLTVILGGLLTLAILQVRTGGNEQARVVAQQHAKLALELALAQLDETTADDRSTTARGDLFDADPKRKHWTAACPMPGAESVWLVSSGELRTTEEVTLVGPGSVEREEEQIRLSPSPIPAMEGKSSPGAIAWWIGDEGIKANLTAGQVRPPATTPEAVATALQGLSRIPGERLHTAWSEATGNDLLAREQLDAFSADEAALPRRKHFHAVTTVSRGLLVNSREGGLRRPLSDDHELAKLFDPSNRTHPDGVLRAFPPGEGPLDEPPLNRASGQHPVPLEILATAGVFYTESDREIRMRMHIEVAFWNPYAQPLDVTSPTTGHRPYWMSIDGLPWVEVRHGISDTLLARFDLDHARNFAGFPGPFFAWMGFREITRDGRSVLQPGEVYRLLEPTQEEGLVRLAQEGSSQNLNETTYQPEDPVRIVVRYQNGSEQRQPRFRLVAVQSPAEFSGRINPSDTTHPLWEVSGVTQEDVSFLLSPSEFRLRESLDYRREDANLAFQLRLADSTGAFDTWTRRRDPRLPPKDFRTTTENGQPLYTTLGINPLETAERSAEAFRPSRFGSDETSRRGGDGAGPRLYDMTASDVISFYAIRHTAFRESSHASLGTTSAHPLHQMVDRYFLPALPPDWQPAYPFPARSTPSGNAFLVPLGQPRTGESWPPPASLWSGKEAAGYWQVEGAFNINSTSVKAWEGVLGNALPPVSLAGESGVELGTAFIRHPFGLRWVESLHDAEGHLLAGSDREGFTWEWTQGAHILPDKDRAIIGQLAETIVEELQEHRKPFHSLEEFLSDGILSRALEQIPSLNVTPEEVQAAPASVMAADVVTAMGPIMASRSDTFTLRVYGDARARDGSLRARVWAEAIVQRLPEKKDQSNPISPVISVNDARRWKIVSFRWLSPDEV